MYSLSNSLIMCFYVLTFSLVLILKSLHTESNRVIVKNTSFKPNTKITTYLNDITFIHVLLENVERV